MPYLTASLNESVGVLRDVVAPIDSFIQNCRMDPAPVPHGEAPSFDTMMTQTAPAPDRPSTRDDVQFATVEETGDRRLAYAEYGAENGSPMVFLHGTPGSRRLAELFESTARDTDVRILAPDRPGYGRSDPWSDRSIRDGGRVVRTVLDHAGIDTARLVAFSGGAPYAFAAAAALPSRIDRLDVVAGATRRSTLASVPRHSEC